MSDFIHFFERNTDANATNRGFLFQYLHTVNEWLNLWRYKAESSKIYCEYEDDIKHVGKSVVSYKQIKYYKSNITFLSEEIKKEFYNSFILQLKHPGEMLEFYFITNKTTQDSIISSWELYKENDFTQQKTVVINIIRDRIYEHCITKRDKEINKISNYKISQEEKNDRIEKIEVYFEDILREIEAFDWVGFCKRITFVFENHTIEGFKSELIKLIDKDVQTLLPARVVYARMLQEVAERSGKEVIEERVITYDSLKLIISEDEQDALQKIQQGKTNIVAVDNELTLIKELLSDIKDNTVATNYKIDLLLESQHKLDKLDRIEDLLERISGSIIPNMNNNIDKIGLQGKIGEEYESSIKEIESIQASYNFVEAIDRYLLLLTELLGQDVDNQVLFRIYNNLAICYINKEDFSTAKKYISKIEKLENIAEKEKFYFAYYFYYLRQNKIAEAYEMISEAYLLNSAYPKALINKLYLEAELGMINIVQFESSVFFETGEVKLHYDTKEQLTDMFNTIGLVYFKFKKYDDAIHWFELGKDDKKDIIPLINIAGCHFCKATEKSTEGKYIFRKDINYAELNKAIEIYESVLFSEEAKKLGEFIKSISYNYMVANFLVNDFEKTLDAFKYIDIERFGEDAQNIYRNKAICEHAMNIRNPETYSKLNEDDRRFLAILELMNHKKYESVIDIIRVYLDGTEETNEVEKCYEVMLEALRQLGRWEEVSQYIKKAWRNDIKSSIINIYEALYYENIDNNGKSKAILEGLIADGNDDYVFYDALIRFYQRNRYDVELYTLLNDLFEKRHNYYQAEKLSFLDMYFDFLVSQNKADEALIAFNKIGSEGISEVDFRRYKAFINRALENYVCVAEESEKLYYLNRKHKYLLNAFDAYMQSHDLVKAEEALLTLDRENYEDKAKLYMAFSDICLLKGEINESFEYARKAKDLKIDLPYDNTHPFFVQRSIRCGKEDGIQYMTEFVENYPKIDKWVWTMKTVEDGTEELTEDFKNFLDNRAKFFKETLKVYNNHAIGISTLSKIFKNDIKDILEWRNYYEISINTYTGEVGETEKEFEHIGNTIVVDALTLMLLEETNCLKLLEQFDKVFITYSTITYLQICLLRSESKEIRSIFKYIKTSLNIEYIYPDYQIKKALEEKNSKIYDISILDSMSVAIKCKCIYIYGDYKIKYDFSEYHNAFLGIYSLVTYSATNSIISDKEYVSIILTMKKLRYEFTPFSGQLLYMLADNNNFVINDDLRMFFDIKSTYNLESFFQVYGVLLKGVFENTSEDKAKNYLQLFLETFHKYYKKSVYYDYLYTRFDDYEAKLKSGMIKAFGIGAVKIIPILASHFNLNLSDYIDFAKEIMKDIPGKEIDKILAK